MDRSLQFLSGPWNSPGKLVIGVSSHSSSCSLPDQGLEFGSPYCSQILPLRDGPEVHPLPLYLRHFLNFGPSEDGEIKCLRPGNDPKNYVGDWAEGCGSEYVAHNELATATSESAACVQYLQSQCQ